MHAVKLYTPTNQCAHTNEPSLMAGRVAGAVMALPPPASEDYKYLPSVSIDPSPADYQQLQDLLQQALKREAEALKKIGHLHQQLESCVRSDCKLTRG